MEQLNPRARADLYGSRINRDHSPWRLHSVPYLTIMCGSLLPVFVLADLMPLVPPLGYLMLLSWRMVRPGLLPLWAGAPLGAFDDLLSGQPFGSAILLWSVTLIIIELIEARFPWRGLWQDWATVTLATLQYLVLTMTVSGATVTWEMLVASLPQALLSVLLYPILARMVARLDRFRLARSRRIG